MTSLLPDVFRFNDGTRVHTTADWDRRRREIRDAIVTLEYGGLPPTPPETRWEELHTTVVKRLDGARFMTCRVQTGPERPYSFLLYLLIPPGAGPFPVALNGDGCWRGITDGITAEVLRRGYILAQFNRVEIVPDVKQATRQTGLYRVYPEGDFGALAAWAWGYHRCVDVLTSMPVVDAAHIAVVGHSRGGKTSLLVGATDERIALTCANDSGAGGAGCFRWQGPTSEKLADLIRNFPYWFGPGLKDYVGREADLPFDQHDLKALVAPRPLLTTEALGDPWANPQGTWQTHRAAGEVYRWLGVGERLGLWYREGGHEHGAADWNALLDFMDWQWRGQPPSVSFDQDPFPGLPPAFTWAAPVSERNAPAPP